MNSFIKHFVPAIMSILFLFVSCSFEGANEPVLPDDLATPHTPNPKDGAVNQQILLSLNWEADNVNKFDVYFDAKNPPTTLYSKDQTSKKITVGGLNYITKYYWKVVSKLNDGTTRAGPVWSLSTKAKSVSADGYIMTQHSFGTELPSYVNVLFQVLDFNGQGIDNLTALDFEVLEDGLPISISESNLTIKKRDETPYTLKTVLLLDNSTSLRSDFTEIKNAAITFVSSLAPNQEVAVFKFSEKIELVQDFTSNSALLAGKISGLNIGFPTTDLYGAVIEGAGKWNDSVTPDKIVQGAMIVFTDGRDTQGSHSLAEVVAAVINKRVYTVGLGGEIDADILERIGNAGFFSVTDVLELTNIFLEIQSEIQRYANSFYWLRYLSPKRGNNNHTIQLSINNT